MSQNDEVEAPEEQYLRLTPGLHTHTHTCEPLPATYTNLVISVWLGVDFPFLEGGDMWRSEDNLQALVSPTV